MSMSMSIYDQTLEQNYITFDDIETLASETNYARDTLRKESQIKSLFFLNFGLDVYDAVGDRRLRLGEL
jgi:hypothetical protein